MPGLIVLPQEKKPTKHKTRPKIAAPHVHQHVVSGMVEGGKGVLVNFMAPFHGMFVGGKVIAKDVKEVTLTVRLQGETEGAAYSMILKEGINSMRDIPVVDGSCMSISVDGKADEVWVSGIIMQTNVQTVKPLND